MDMSIGPSSGSADFPELSNPVNVPLILYPHGGPHVSTVQLIFYPHCIVVNIFIHFNMQ